MIQRKHDTTAYKYEPTELVTSPGSAGCEETTRPLPTSKRLQQQVNLKDIEGSCLLYVTFKQFSGRNVYNNNGELLRLGH